jgi:hypothetical protein
MFNTDYSSGPCPQDVMPCPYCQFPCSADYVDIGVGWQQCGPFHCERCFASEIGGFDKVDWDSLEEQERRTGWYKPGSPAGSSVNTVDGIIVKHQEAKLAYRMGMLDMKDPF